MWQKVFITKEVFKDFAKDAPNTSLVILYSLSRYHEKYNLTQWVMEELSARGFTKDAMGDFDTNFSNFYDQMLKQDDL